MLRPADWLPPKRLLTPRSDAAISHVAWGLLRGAPVLTAAGLSPAGEEQHEADHQHPLRHDAQQAHHTNRGDGVKQMRRKAVPREERNGHVAPGRLKQVPDYPEHADSGQ